MELGKRLRQARLELGLSQRQLCGDEITRNMLSQIENGIARPSMDTLKYLAGRLGKPVSYFLDEDTVTSPNLVSLGDARQAVREGRWDRVLEALRSIQGRDPVFREEVALLRYLTCLNLAKQAIAEGKKPYAEEMLDRAGAMESIYITPALERERLLLLVRAGDDPANLPSIDEELLLYARAALARGDHARCAALLDGAEDRSGGEWNLLRGKAYLNASDWAAAAACLHRAEGQYPAETAPLLETAYRELGDYKMAYEYACKQR